jgi:hypothetical protein
MPNALSWAGVGGGEGGAPFLVLGALGVPVPTAEDGPAVAAELDAETPVAAAAEPAGAGVAAAAEAAGAAEVAGAGLAACPDADSGKTTPAKTANSTGTKA